MPSTPTDAVRVLAGDCTVRFEPDDDGARDRVQRGHVVTVVKPDRTTLVHDAAGYQPVAWLTRPDAITVERDGDGFGLTARAGERTLRVVSHAVAGSGEYPVGEAGVPVCPAADGTFVRTDGAVRDLDAGERYPLVAGATVLDEPCSCGRPRMRVARGAPFDVCVDRACEPLDDAVRERFDGAWTCPESGDPLRVLRRRGRLVVGCDAYPDCETTFTIPTGTVVGECACGLPRFETATGERCLDGACAHDDG